jgi:Cys-Gly metallodipeptidase DUG1
VSRLVTTDGKILIPGLMDLVAPLTEEERKRYEVINASIEVSFVCCGPGDAVI